MNLSTLCTIADCMVNFNFGYRINYDLNTYAIEPRASGAMGYLARIASRSRPAGKIWLGRLGWPGQSMQRDWSDSR